MTQTMAVGRPEEARLLAKVARLYYEDGLRQAQIAAQLDLSQATVSRLLKGSQSAKSRPFVRRIPTRGPTLGGIRDLTVGSDHR